jgi:hypothetical protein
MEIIENEENPYSRNMKKNTEENPNPFGSHIIIGALAAFVYIYIYIKIIFLVRNNHINNYDQQLILQ